MCARRGIGSLAEPPLLRREAAREGGSRPRAYVIKAGDDWYVGSGVYVR